MAEKNVEESYSVSLFSVVEKFFAQEGYVMIFLSKIFCLTVPKKLVHGAFSVSLIPGVEKVHA